MSQKLEDAKVKLKRADRYLKLSIGVFVVFMMVATGVMSYQLLELQQGLYRQQARAEAQAKADRQEAQKRLEQALEENARQHRQTQEYVKCVAKALSTPLANRSDKVFDRCGIETDQPASPPAASSSQPATMPTPVKRTTPSNQQATTSSPPDPDEPNTPARPSFVDAMLRALGVKQ